jgi:hypothetical protein
MFSRGKKRDTSRNDGLQIYTPNATQGHEADMGDCGVNL